MFVRKFLMASISDGDFIIAEQERFQGTHASAISEMVCFMFFPLIGLRVCILLSKELSVFDVRQYT